MISTTTEIIANGLPIAVSPRRSPPAASVNVKASPAKEQQENYDHYYDLHAKCPLFFWDGTAGKRQRRSVAVGVELRPGLRNAEKAESSSPNERLKGV